jgi:hypothetical protein
MTYTAKFYRERDDRSAAYLGQEIIAPLPVQVYWDGNAATTPGGQQLILATANLLARFCRAGSFSGPDARTLNGSPVSGATLHEAVLKLAHAIDPLGRWTLGTDSHACYRIGIGAKCASSDIYLGSFGWAGFAVVHASDLPPFIDANPLGYGIACCIGLANAFKVSNGLANPLTTGAFSTWSLNRDGAPGPDLAGCLHLGSILMVGAGAVASCLSYWVRLLPISAHWDIVDPDTAKLHNTNRSMLFTAADAGWPSAAGRRKSQIVAERLEGATAHDVWFDEFHTDGRRWDVYLALANDRGVRAALQAQVPPLILHATTSSNWYTQLHRHRPVRDRCLCCRFSDVSAPALACAEAPIRGNDEGSLPHDAALPFLSAAAGLLLASDLVRLAMRVLKNSRGNLHTIDWYGDLGRPTMRQEACDPNCAHWPDEQVRRALNRTTRWFDVDSSVS